MSKLKLKLYIIGRSALAEKAIHNLYKIVEKPPIKDKYEVEVIDLLVKPELAESEKIIATPVLIKELPLPMRRVIGDLSDHAKVLVGLNCYEL
ncbi:MAG: circadian clock KaiB family protein [Legionellaceae bacterium]|nr:circadian clock KaiB family protein [Legionellaceae bacterium]